MVSMSENQLFSRKLEMLFLLRKCKQKKEREIFELKKKKQREELSGRDIFKKIQEHYKKSSITSKNQPQPPAAASSASIEASLVPTVPIPKESGFKRSRSATNRSNTRIDESNSLTAENFPAKSEPTHLLSSKNPAEGFCAATSHNPTTNLSAGSSSFANSSTINFSSRSLPPTSTEGYSEDEYYVNTIYVGGLRDHTPQQELERAFQRFGEISEIRSIPNKNFAFVTFISAHSARNAMMEMDGKMVAGTFLRVSRARIPNPNHQNHHPSPNFHPRGFRGRPYQNHSIDVMNYSHRATHPPNFAARSSSFSHQHLHYWNPSVNNVTNHHHPHHNTNINNSSGSNFFQTLPAHVDSFTGQNISEDTRDVSSLQNSESSPKEEGSSRKIIAYDDL